MEAEKIFHAHTGPTFGRVSQVTEGIQERGSYKIVTYPVLAKFAQ